jgi:cell division protein FtsB
MPWTDEEVRELVRQSSTGTGGCPPAETLARAMSGSLPRDESEAMADHLGECADCAEDAQALRNLESWAERATLEDATPGRHTREVARRHWTSHPLAAVAATLLLAIAGLSFGLWRVRTQGLQAQAELQASLDASARTQNDLRAELDRLRAGPDVAPGPSEPQAVPNVAIVDLLPAGASRAGGSVAAVPEGAPLVVGVLTVPSDTPRYEGYAVEVWRGARIAYRGQGFVRSREDTFTIALPAALLARGENRVRLLGLRAGRSTPIEEYALRGPNS